MRGKPLVEGHFKDGVVTTPNGFKEAYQQFTEGGWQGLQHPVEFGGQRLPKTIGAACAEMLNSASLSFALCPLLTDGAIEALLTAGSAEQQRFFLPKMIDGTWTGTMNLTEPQAGSDLSLVRTRAEPQPDGTYKLFGTKIFITWGEHDMAENIVHLVLARVSGAPEGVKGISLFVVPKFMVNKDGSLGARNDVHCVSIEHKMGIKASPTAVLQYGDHGGAAEADPAIGHAVAAGVEAVVEGHRLEVDGDAQIDEVVDDEFVTAQAGVQVRELGDGIDDGGVVDPRSLDVRRRRATAHEHELGVPIPCRGFRLHRSQLLFGEGVGLGAGAFRVFRKLQEVADRIDGFFLADHDLRLHADLFFKCVCVADGFQPRGIDRVLADILVQPDPSAEPWNPRTPQDDDAGAHGSCPHAREQHGAETFLRLIGYRQEFA